MSIGFKLVHLSTQCTIYVKQMHLHIVLISKNKQTTFILTSHKALSKLVTVETV